MSKMRIKVSIDHSAFDALLMKCSANPLAEAEIPPLLKAVIEGGGRVVLTGDGNSSPAELRVKDGKFVVEYRD